MQEIRKYIRDLFRDGKLIYRVTPLDDGRIELYRMRLKEEDYPGATEYVACMLQEVEIDVCS